MGFASHRSFAARRQGHRWPRPAVAYARDPNPLAVFLAGIAWSPPLKLWAAVGFATGAQSYILTSPGHGGAWTPRAAPRNVNQRSVCWTGARFCAVGDFDGLDANVLTSVDGINWVESPSAGASQLYGVASDGAGHLLAVGQVAGPGTMVRSDDHGATWANASGAATDLQAVVWTGVTWVVVGGAAAGKAVLLTSPDRAVFTQRANPLNLGLWCVAYGAGRLVAGGDATGAGGYCLTSDDQGATWSGPFANPAPGGGVGALRGMTYTGRQFIASGGGGGAALTSRDAQSWVRLPDVGANAVNVAAGNGEVLIVGGPLAGDGALIARYTE